MGEQRALTAVSERISLLPGQLGVYTRQAFYRHVLRGVGDDVYLGFLSVFSKASARLGHRVYIGRNCCIGWADIGDDVMLADGVQLLSGRHQHGSRAGEGDQPLRDNEQHYESVAIGSGAWIGAGAIVMADVGANAVVGAGAVVVKPVPAGMRVAGVPARPIDRPILAKAG